MSVWDTYESRVTAHGSTKRNATLLREQRYLSSKMRDSLSFQSVVVDGVERDVSIINSDNLNEKLMLSPPGEDFDCGGLVDWADNHWLITEKDANNEVYTRVKLVQCNYLLKWVDDDNLIHEQWCIIEDGTKLKHVLLCNSLARRKRRAKRIPLIAGNPLEPFEPQHRFETIRCDGLKIKWIGQSAAKLRTGEGSTTIPDVGVGASAPKWGTLTRLTRYGEDIVCASQKVRRCA